MKTTIYTLFTLSGTNVAYSQYSLSKGTRDVSFRETWCDGVGGNKRELKPLPPFQEIQASADRMRDKVERIYGGTWIIEYHVSESGEYYDPSPEPPVGSVRNREQARHDAESMIMAGPDTPGKRFIMGLCRGPLAEVLPIKPVFDSPVSDDDTLPF